MRGRRRLLAALVVVGAAGVTVLGVGRGTVPSAHAAIAESAAATEPVAHVDRTWIVTVPGADLEDLLRVPSFAALATGHGGAAVMVREGGDDPVGRIVRAAADPASGLDVRVIALAEDQGTPAGGWGEAARAAVGRIRERSRYQDVQVIVVGTAAPAVPNGGTQPLSAAVVASGPVDTLFSGGRLRTLTSDSTERVGVIDDDDIVPTVFDAQGYAGPTGGGAAIRVVDRAPPLDLVARYRQLRRLVVPIGAAAVAYVTLGGVLAALALRLRRRLPPWALGLAAAIPISVPALGTAMLLVGHLPSLGPVPVTAILVGVSVAAIVVAEVAVRRVGPRTVLAGMGVAVIVALVVEAVVGWTAMLTPLLGGSQLDGGRFFGLPNVAIGLLLGAAVMVAQRLRSVVAGTAVIVAAGLFAGMPWTGSNFGGAVTLLAAAGLWLGLRRGGAWWTVVLWTGTVAAVGLAAVILAHRYLVEAPTHITNAVEGDLSVGTAWGHYLARLQIGVDLLQRNPVAIVPVIGAVVVVGILLRPPPSIRPSLEARAWHDALVTVALGSIVAYLANDSGASALGLGFGWALGGMLYVSLQEARGMMDPR